MNIYLINCFIKFIGMNLCVSYIFVKLFNGNFSNYKKALTVLLAIFIATLQYSLQNYTAIAFRIFIVYFIYSLIFGKLTAIKIGNSIVITTLSLTMYYIVSFLSTIILTIFLYILLGIPYTNPLVLFSISCLNFILIYAFFRIRRFKYGLSFMRNSFYNEYLDIFTIVLSVIILSIRFLCNNLSNSSILYFIINFALFTVLTLIIIQKTLILYQKSKLLIKTIENYKQELEETKLKLKTALEEKQKLVKSNHEFYHRQEAIMKKLEDLGNTQSFSTNTEFGAEYGDILDRINKLSDEYYEKTHIIPKLIKTNIVEIDDILLYFQSECQKNNIEFILKIDCDIKDILDKFISQSQLETLLGDLINNAIIAVNHSHNTFKSIMVIFGIVDTCYELCVYDSGIPFEIETLLALGTKPASTHENEGGTGIGFITTFETLDATNASFIINELTNSNYTKSLEIKFDGKHEYIIISDRQESIREKNNLNRNIIIK